MAEKCRICHNAYVDAPGQVCDSCRLRYPDSGGSTGGAPAPGRVRRVIPAAPAATPPLPAVAPPDAVARPTAAVPPAPVSPSWLATPPTSKAAVPADQPPPQATQVSPGCLQGVVKNVREDNQSFSLVRRWFRSLSHGLPFSFDQYVTSFQLFPQQLSQTASMAGKICDNVVVHGRILSGSVVENNIVRIWGHRLGNGEFLASRVRICSSDTDIRVNPTLPAWLVWLLTLAIPALLIAGLSQLQPADISFEPTAEVPALAQLVVGLVVLLLLWGFLRSLLARLRVGFFRWLGRLLVLAAVVGLLLLLFS